ncbi:hypothetical protein EV182_004122, partial [Spiromyces aspiralis]
MANKHCDEVKLWQQIRDTLSDKEGIDLDAILSKCSILHCDILTNNILVIWPESGCMRGMLIDFNCMVDTEGSEGDAQIEVIGMHPFMSVLNLEDSPG